MKRVSRAILKVLLAAIAAVGTCVLGACIWILLHMPKASGRPNSFIIVEILGLPNGQSPLARIYLEAPSSATDLKFEGDSLKHEFKGVQHEQAAVPLSGVVVSGSGTIVFGSSQIKIDGGRVSIDNRLLSSCETGSILLGTPSFELRDNYKRPGPTEIVLGRNGWYFEGYVHLGGQRLFTSQLNRAFGGLLTAEHKLWSETSVCGVRI